MTLWQVPGSTVYHVFEECVPGGTLRAIPDEYPGRLCRRCKSRRDAEAARLHPLPAFMTRPEHPHSSCRECYGGEERRAGRA